MKREEFLATLAAGTDTWDFIVAGGGATGLGVAVDAATRGFKVLLLEQADFSKATSSRSTKLVHGGVRYLAQGDVGLVVEALRERGIMRRNAPHLVKDQRFIIGAYKWWEKPFHTVGLTVYDALAGKRGFGRSMSKSRKNVLKEIPGIQQRDLKGGILYHDGQFDDSRMAVNLMQTAVDHGATVVNYVRVTGLLKDPAGKILGVQAQDSITGNTYEAKCKVLINATGIFVDDLIKMDAPEKDNLVRPSQGVHLIVDASFLGGETAIMIPKTSDGRVLFGVPWHGRVILGTTDTPLKEFVLEPKALDQEVEFILDTAGQYLSRKPTRQDVLAVYAGLRPLAAPKSGSDEQKTKELSRSHKVITTETGMVTITGGKWTTYRDMAEDTVDKAIQLVGLPERKCKTWELKIHGYMENVDRSNYRYVYGSDHIYLRKIEEEQLDLARPLHDRLDHTGSEVVWAIRQEMAVTLEDVLARRLRALFLDARAAIDIAPEVAGIMAREMGKDSEWGRSQVEEFVELAQNYLLVPYRPENRNTES